MCFLNKIFKEIKIAISFAKILIIPVGGINLS